MAETAYYSNPDDVRKWWGADEADIRPEVMRKACTIAYSLINSTLNGIYTVPFSTTTPPGEVQAISDMLTKWLALMLSVKRGGQAISRKDIKTPNGDAEFAWAWLNDIARGLRDIVGQTRLSACAAYHTMSDYMTVFDLDDSLYHAPDDDYMDTVEDER